jgi:hypothetical protein
MNLLNFNCRINSNNLINQLLHSQSWSKKWLIKLDLMRSKLSFLWGRIELDRREWRIMKQLIYRLKIMKFQQRCKGHRFLKLGIWNNTSPELEDLVKMVESWKDRNYLIVWNRWPSWKKIRISGLWVHALSLIGLMINRKEEECRFWQKESVRKIILLELKWLVVKALCVVRK